MAPYSDDEFESDVDEDIVAAEPSEAEMPRVSPATKLKPMPRVYQPVYPASPMTIAGYTGWYTRGVGLTFVAGLTRGISASDGSAATMSSSTSLSNASSL